MDRSGYITSGLICMLWATIGMSPVAAAPAIELSEYDINLGRLYSGQMIEHVLTISNIGDSDLHIRRLSACCGTSVSPTEIEAVKPGAEIPIEVLFRVPVRAGHRVRTVEIESNCPDRPQTSVRISFQAAAAVRMSRHDLFFGRVSPNEPTTGTIDIVTADGIAIEEISTSSSSFNAVLETVEADREYRVHVSTQPPLASGAHSARLGLLTDVGLRFEIPVFATVMGPAAYAPTELVLPRMQDAALTRHIIVRAGTAGEFKITGVDCPDLEMAASVAPLGGSGYRVTIENLRPREELDGRYIVIGTDVDGMDRIKVPIRILR